MKYFQLAWRNIFRNRRRSILSMAAITVAALVITFMFALIAGMKKDMKDNFIHYYTGEVQIRTQQYADYEYLQPIHLAMRGVEEKLTTLEQVEQVKSAVPRLTVPAAVFQEDRRIGLMGVGVDFDREEEYTNISENLLAGEMPTMNASVSRSNGPRVVPALVGPGLANRLGMELGDTFTILVRTATRGSNAMTFEITGLVEFPVATLMKTMFWAPLPAMQRLVQLPDGAIEILVQLNDRTNAAEATRAIQAALAGGETELQIRHWSNIETSYSLMQIADVAYGFIGLIFFLLASSVIVNTTMMVIFERKQEIGTLEAMGMRTGQLIKLFLTESFLMSVIGAALGTLIGVGISFLFQNIGIDFTEALQGVDFEMSGILYPQVRLGRSLFVFVFAVVVASITSYFPTRRITRIQPVDALREE